MAHMTIMRGGPGSGKSTFVEKLKTLTSDPLIVCSADHYFINDEGDYDFNPDRLEAAHASCLNKCATAMVTSRPDIIIDNTNAKPQSMIPYFALARAFGYKVGVVQMRCRRSVAWERQTHGVSAKKFHSTHTCIEQTQVPGRYRNALWVTYKEVRTDGQHPLMLPLPQPYRSPDAPTVWKPHSGARCIGCGMIIVYSEGGRYCDHECDTCECPDGTEKPSEPFAGAEKPRPGRPACNCGVSLGIRSDHEGECAATYIQKKKKDD